VSGGDQKHGKEKRKVGSGKLEGTGPDNRLRGAITDEFRSFAVLHLADPVYLAKLSHQRILSFLWNQGLLDCSRLVLLCNALHAPIVTPEIGRPVTLL
jgi:hypothetical protein